MNEYNKDNAVIREAIRKAEEIKKEKKATVNVAYRTLYREIKGKVSMPVTEYEKELFELRFNNFKNTLHKLSSKNKFEFDLEFKKGALKELNFIYSHNPINRTGFKEEVKKQIATRRHQSVIAETNITKAQKDYDDYEKNQKFENKYVLAIDDAKNEVIKSYNAVNPSYKTLKELYDEIDSEYETYITKEHTFIDELIQKHFGLVEESYNRSLLVEPKTEMYNTGVNYLDKKEELSGLLLRKADLEEDIYVFTVSLEQKIDVTAKLKAVQAQLAELDKEIEKVSQEEAKLKEKYDRACANLIELTKANEEALKQKTDKQVEGAALEAKIKLALLKSQNLFADLTNLFAEEIKKHFDSYEVFKNKKLSTFKEEESAYRKEKLAKSNSEQEKQAYSLPIEKYLESLTINFSKENEAKIQETNQKYDGLKAEIEKQYHDELKKIYEDREKRKVVYLEKKEETKLKLKNADANAAAELKDILKIYKEDIKAGDKQRIEKAKKVRSSALKENDYNKKLEISKLSKPATTTLTLQYQKEKAEMQATLKKENSYLKLRLSKEVNLNKYRKNMNKTKRESILGYIFLSIWAIGFVLLTFIPIVYSILISLSNVISDVNGYSPVISLTGGKLFPNFVGPDNYLSIFIKDVNFFYTYLPTFAKSLLLFAPIVLFISFVIAILLNQKIVGRTFFRVIYFLPVVIVSGPLLNMLNSSNSSGGSSLQLSLEGSFVYELLLVAGEKAAEYANFVFQNFVIILWMTGVPIVLFINGLQKIDRSLYEAAEIDGANKWQSLWTVTYPLIKSVALISSLFIILQIATIDISWVNPIRTHISSQMSASSANFGVIAAMGWVQALMVIITVLIAFLIFKEKVYRDNQKSYEEIEALKEKRAMRKERREQILRLNEIKGFIKKITTKKVKVNDVNTEGGK